MLSAFVLHQYDWSESSLIVDLFTREQGRIAVVAKGAKRPYSQLRSVLIPFNRIHVGLGRAARSGSGDEQATPEVQTLRSAEWAGGGSGMPAGAALFSGFYLNELLLKLLARNDPHPLLFDAYAATVPALSPLDAPSTVLRDDAREPSPVYAASLPRRVTRPGGTACFRIAPAAAGGLAARLECGHCDPAAGRSNVPAIVWWQTPASSAPMPRPISPAPT